MKAKLSGVMVVALLLLLVFAVVAQAAVPQTVIDAIILDAQDGTIDGDPDTGRDWTAAEIQAALDFIAANPALEQYSDLEGVLSDYLASLQAPGAQGGELAFTGSEILLVIGAGIGLIGSGVALRRRRG
jgi:hypothetical protein